MRHLLTGGTKAACLLVFAAAAANAPAQDYPNRNLRLIVPFSAGGGSDLHARTLGRAMNELWKNHSIVVENMGGAGGGRAASFVKQAEPDGYTVFFATHPILAINPWLYKKLAYDPVKDFAPVVKLGETALMLLVNASTQVKTVPELIKLAKDQPGKLNFGTGGPGTTQHLSAELFKYMAGIDIVHIPFKGGALANAALMSGQIHLQFDSAYPGMRLMQAGKLRGIAVTSKNRLPPLPDMPTMGETLKGYESVLGYGILVPAGTPKPIVAALNQAINKVLADPAYKAEMAKRAIYLDGGSPEAFASWLAEERKRWGALIKRIGLTLG